MWENTREKKKLQPYIAVYLIFLRINIWNKRCEAPERVVLLGFGSGIQNLGNKVGKEYQQSLEIPVKEIPVKRKIQRKSWIFQQATYLKISPGHTAEYCRIIIGKKIKDFEWHPGPLISILWKT